MRADDNTHVLTGIPTVCSLSGGDLGAADGRDFRLLQGRLRLHLRGTAAVASVNLAIIKAQKSLLPSSLLTATKVIVPVYYMAKTRSSL